MFLFYFFSLKFSYLPAGRRAIPVKSCKTLSGEHRPACRRQGINFISVSSLPDGRQVWFLSYSFIFFHILFDTTKIKYQNFKIYILIFTFRLLKATAHPCLCLCLGFLHTTLKTPFLFTIRHLAQIFFIDALTFINTPVTP